MLKGVYLLLLGALAVSVRAIINDWSTPCFGSCAYDVSSSHLEAVFYISGDDTAVSDLTPAAGWTILDCATDGLAQDIRAVCNSTDVDSPCNHLFQGGAVDTVVRLPEDCTDMQFARIAAVASESTSDERDVDASSPVVQVFSVDANFSAIEASQKEKVSFWVQTAGMPSAELLGTAIPPEVRLLNNQTGSIPVNYNGYATIFNESINCPQSGDRPDLSESVLIGFDAGVTASLSYGFNVAATLTDVTDFNLYASFEGFIDGILNVNTTTGASIDTGLIKTPLTFAIDEITIKGILTVGPVLTFFVEGTASIDVELNMAAGVNYTFQNAELYFPHSNTSSTTSSGLFQPGSTNVDLEGAADILVNTTLTAHLIPTITFGIDVLGSDGPSAGIALQLDAFLSLLLDLEESASISVANITGSKSKAEAAAFNGSVTVLGGLDVGVEANASFLNIFNEGDGFIMYQTSLQLYQDSFGDSGPSKRDLILAPHRSLAQRSDTAGNGTLKCSLN